MSTPPGRPPTEAAAREALADLEATYAVERARLEGELNAAKAAEPVRYGLLYGTGKSLEDAVETVLRAAGFTVVNLDDELGGTESADLLATYGSERRLVEVKSASGNAPEKLVSTLERHLATWPSLRPNDPVGGGVLVVNHQHRKEPGERSTQVYERTAFVDSLTVEVLGSRDCSPGGPRATGRRSGPRCSATPPRLPHLLRRRRRQHPRRPRPCWCQEVALALETRPVGRPGRAAALDAPSPVDG